MLEKLSISNIPDSIGHINNKNDKFNIKELNETKSHYNANLNLIRSLVKPFENKLSERSTALQSELFQNKIDINQPHLDSEYLI